MLIGYLVSDHLHRSEHVIRVPVGYGAVRPAARSAGRRRQHLCPGLVVAYALYTRMPVALMVATFNLSFITSKSGQIIGLPARARSTSGVACWRCLPCH